eukprot:Phypoly_transcript_03538.p1 GENE.Phypoly_transcript_03538~~Phypoly_transcript_03538.p1  ORF type:complete len:683 (+),score=114.19 Phypoly_transcript_03538:324-2372(+)
MSVRRIVQSVLSCKFDEDACSQVENLASTNREQGFGILDAIENSELKNHSETFSSAQVAVYLTYIHRFVVAYGHDIVPLSYKTSICNYLDTKDSELSAILINFGKLIMAKDDEICEFVFQYHFKNRENPLPLRLISAYAELEGKHFFGKLNEFLLDKTTQFYALELLGKIVNNQGARLHEIVETPCFNSLLSLLETEETLLIVLALAVRILAMLLPFIPTSLPPLLDRLLAIMAKIALLSWKNTHQPISVLLSKDMKPITFRRSKFFKESQQLGVCVGLFVVFLYGMFPISFLDFIRLPEQKQIIFAVQPLLSKLAFNSNMLLSKENETSVERWKTKDPHDIVAECMEFTKGGDNDSAGDNSLAVDSVKQQLVSQQKLGLILAAQDNFRKEANTTPQDRFHNAVHKQEKMWLQYLLHQYQQRAAHLGREAMLTRARADEMLSANTRIPVLEAEILALNKHATRQAQEHAQALAREHAWALDTTEKLTKLKAENDALVERCGSLLFDATQLEASRQELIEEVRDKSERLVQLELRLQDAYDELTQTETENTKLRVLSEDLMYWRDQQSIKPGETDMDLLQEEIEQRDENIRDLVEQLEAANAQISALTESYQQGLILLQQLEQEKAEWQEQMSFARNVLEKQRVVDAAKLKSVEEKYTSVKSLYLGVEKRMLELRSENDKARQ